MPIRSLLAETNFNAEQTEMIAKAFDDAWARLQGDEADPAMASLVRTALAKRIIETARRPGIDLQKLRDDAIAYVKNNPLWPTPLVNQHQASLSLPDANPAKVLVRGRRSKRKGPQAGRGAFPR